MTATKVVQCAGPSYHLIDKKAAIQNAINCYPQQLNDGEWIMVAAPGEAAVATLAGIGRGSRNVGGRWFVVALSTLYEMVPDGARPPNFTAVVRGTLNSFSGFVGMAHNQTQLGIVDGLNYYVLTLATNVLQQITVPGWLGSDDIYEDDGYFVFVRPNTDQFYISAVDDGTTIDPLDFSSADSIPDIIVTHRVSHRQLWFFGREHGEIWVDSGGGLDSSGVALFPFVRYESYTLDVGIVGERAAINAADTLFWIGQSRSGRGIVYQAAGNQPQRVSTLAVEQALRGSTDLSQATMWTYQTEGHEFIGINAPGLETTWVFDAAENMWHERAEYAGAFQPLRSRLTTALNGEQYGIDANGAVTRQDTTLNTLSGRPLVRERTWPHFIQDSLEPTSFRSLELAMKTGSTTQGSVTLRISNDGGFTFGPPLIRSLGVTGRVMQRVRWLGLGTALNRVFRIRVTDDVPFTIHQAAVQT